MHDAEVIRAWDINIRPSRRSRTPRVLFKRLGLIHPGIKIDPVDILGLGVITFGTGKAFDILRLVEIGGFSCLLVTPNILPPLITIFGDDDPQFMPVLGDEETSMKGVKGSVSKKKKKKRLQGREGELLTFVFRLWMTAIIQHFHNEDPILRPKRQSRHSPANGHQKDQNFV